MQPLGHGQGETQMATIRIAQCQLPVPVYKSDTIALLRRTFDEIAPREVDLITLPEMFCCPYQVENFPRYAEEEQGEMWEACSDLAQRHRVYLSAGSMPERDHSGQIYNTAYVFDRSGRQIAKHRKMHLFDSM